MKKYAKIINENTKEVQIGVGCPEDFYIEIGMSKMEVEQAYNGCWYIKDYAPKKPIPTEDEMKQEIRATRNYYLEKYVDSKIKNPFMWEDLSEEEKIILGKYRKYLLDYTKEENWWEKEPLLYGQWVEENISKENNEEILVEV